MIERQQRHGGVMNDWKFATIYLLAFWAFTAAALWAGGELMLGHKETVAAFGLALSNAADWLAGLV
jgi:hypothetical protein